MPQISRRKLPKELEEEMFSQFWVSLSRLRTSDNTASFFSDLLTDTEELMLAKRFTIAVLLLRGKRPVDIKATLHVTNSTIGVVASWVKNAKPRTQKLLELLIQEGKWQGIIDRIDGLLDELPPPYRTNWHAAGKAKWQRKVERSARQSLR